MKPLFPNFFALATAFGATLTLPLSAGSSETVGFITTEIAGNTIGTASGAATFISPTLTEPNAFVGISTNNPAATDTVTFDSNITTAFDNSYLLEITEGEYEGWWTTVQSSSASSVVISGVFPADLTGVVNVAVRKFVTLKSFLGDNSLGLKDFDGIATDYDEIQILNPIDQSTKVAVYILAASGVTADGWYDTVTLESLDSEIIYPGTAVKVVRRGTEPLSLVSTGKVKDTKTMVALAPSYNWIGQPLAVGDNYQGLSLASQLAQFDGVTENYDTVEVINPDQSTDVYAGLDPSVGMGEIMIDIVTIESAETKEFPEGSGLIINRDATNGGTTLVFPAQQIGQTAQ